MSGHHSLRAFLSGGGNKKAPEMDLAASQALYQSLSFWGRPASPSQRDLERSRRSQAALQSSEYVSGSCFVARGEEAPAGFTPPSDWDVRLEC